MSTKNIISKGTIKLIWSRSYSAIAASERNPWSAENVVSSPFNHVKIPNTTIVNYIWEKIEKWPNKTATVCAVTNQSYTYHQIYKYSRNLAARLRSHFHIRDGDVVCVMMPNNPQYCIALLGGLEAGAVLTTVNPIYTAHEVHRQLLLSNPKAVICTTDTVKVIKDALKLAKMDIPIITTKTGESDLSLDTVNFEELTVGDNVDHSILKEVKRKSDDVALLPYSSGTTGLPKGVELVNRNLVSNFAQVEGIEFFNRGSEAQDSVLCVLPFYHIYGMSVVMLQRLAVGSKLVTIPKFQPDLFLKTLKDHRISVLPAVPPMILFLGSHPDSKKEHLEHVRLITCGAAPLPKHDIEKLLEKTNPEMNFNQIYGLTETSPLVTVEPPGLSNHQVAGVPIPNTELKIIGEGQRALGPDQVGELLIRGPQVMKGYRNNEEATKKSIDNDGWFYSGDLAALSKDGVLTIHDRLKELIKVKGYQVPPAELESILKEHPSILDAAVLGVPDSRSGEVPKAFVVLKDGQKQDSKGIEDFVKERVAEYKRLKEVIFLKDLPRSAAGKILKNELKAKYC